MSDNWDDDVWDPVIDIIEENKLVEVPIDVIKKADLERVRDSAKKCLLSKLEKLNVILKNLDVYCHNGSLLVNDRYGICNEVVEIAEAFGFTAEKITSGLKGKSYLIHDNLFNLIRVLDPIFDISEFANKIVNSEILEIFEKGKQILTSNENLQSILQTILRTGHYSITGTQRIVTTYEDGHLVDSYVGDVVSDREAVTETLREYLKSVQSELKSANSDLQNGTVKLLYHRARQMGYAVKEERNGTQVQLVLVRAE